MILQKLQTRPAAATNNGQVVGEDKPSVNASMETACKMRDQCMGTMHLVTAALADEAFHFDACMIDFAGGPLVKWQMELDRDLRSSGQAGGGVPGGDPSTCFANGPLASSFGLLANAQRAPGGGGGGAKSLQRHLCLAHVHGLVRRRIRSERICAFSLELPVF